MGFLNFIFGILSLATVEAMHKQSGKKNDFLYGALVGGVTIGYLMYDSRDKK